MKYAIPEISWHNRDPVLSVDFQPNCASGDPLRLATGGTDSHVLIWYISTTEKGSVNLEVAADLTRHQKAVNAVRWSPSGELLASGDDESIIFVWKQKHEEPTASIEGEEQYKESWVIHKTLRGHMEDVLDISWSADSLHLASGSVDNKLVLWDVARGRYSHILADHKGFVQGVAWDPRGQFVATTSSDRTFRTFDVTTKKVVSRSSKAILPFPSGHPLHETTVRLYHDDTLQTYYRRLAFSPDGLLIAVPAGRIEAEQGKVDMKPINAVYIYTRYSLKVPAVVLPCGEPALAVRWSPVPLAPRAAPALPAPRRLLAVATRRSLLIYDTHQRTPVAIVSNIHYTRLTDLTWSPDARALVASSTDGFCSVLSFHQGELGEALHLPDASHTPPSHTEPMEIGKSEDEPQTEPAADKNAEAKSSPKDETKKAEPKSTTSRIDSFMKFKSPSDQSPTKKQKTDKQKMDQKKKTPVKFDVLVETAMPSWSDNSNSDVIKPVKEKEKPSEVIEIEDSEDIKLVYEDTCKADSPKHDSEENNKMETAVNEDKIDTGTDKDKTENENNTTEKDSTDEKTEAKSPERKRISPTSIDSPASNFLKQAKVTDVRESAVPPVASPRAPRRVSFVTLSSPKNKKKC